MITTEKAAPTFENATQAAAFIEALCRSYIQKDPSLLHIDSRKVNRERDGNAIHVTELAGDCLRQGFFRMRGVERDYSDEVDAHWAHTGTLYEELIRAVFRVEYPGRLRAQMPVPGLPDGVAGTLDLFWLDAWVVMDVKSRRVGWVPADKESRQLAIYAAHLSKKYGHPIFAVIVAAPREDLSKISAFPVEYDVDAVLASTVARADYLTTCVKDGTPPPVEPQMRSDEFPCSFQTRDGLKTCAFFTRCHADAKGAKAVVPPEVIAVYVAEHKTLAAEMSRLNAEIKPVEARKKELEGLIQPFAEEVGGLIAGPADADQDLKRIPYAGRTSYDTETAFAKDPELEGRLEPYKSVGAGYFQWRWVRRKGGK